ncbi:hypothetical protein BC628DRAFT_1334464, partial [Trametes gibbosa]
MIAAEATDSDFELGQVELSDWAEGTEAYHQLSIPDMARIFALPTERMPFFNDKIDMIGNDEPWSEAGRQALKSRHADPLEPFWHQWVTMVKISDNLMVARNLFIWDGVGVGKTMQAIAGICSYEWLKMRQGTPEGLPLRFSKPPFSSPDGADQRPTEKTPMGGMNTLFSGDHKYGMLIFDEVHNARKVGPVQVASAELVRHARMSIGMTATP